MYYKDSQTTSEREFEDNSSETLDCTMSPGNDESIFVHKTTFF